MLTGPLSLFDNALNRLVAGSFPALQSSPMSAVLLAPSYTPNITVDSRFADVSAYELLSAIGLRLQLTGVSVSGASFFSDDLVFGDPVTLGPVRYLVFVEGRPAAINPDSLLLAYADLAPSGGMLEAQRGRFSVAAPTPGWFQLTRV